MVFGRILTRRVFAPWRIEIHELLSLRIMLRTQLSYLCRKEVSLFMHYIKTPANNYAYRKDFHRVLSQNRFWD